VGYALAGRDIAVELNQRQHPAPLSTLSAALAIAALESPPDVRPIIEERERFAERLRGLGFAPLPSHANFLYVPVDEPQGLADKLLGRGLAVRPVRGGIRITIRNEQDDERLIAVLDD
jgi:histidinol-phosphate/aromatic aminotransferase/cobyric acid decarboxylase-like protein